MYKENYKNKETLALRATRYTLHDPRERGQMLIEALVAMSVLVFAVLGIFTLISRSVSLNRVVSDQYVGSYLAAEGIEIVKNIIDSNVLRCDSWNQNDSGSVLSGTYEASYYDTTLHAPNGAPLNFDTSGFYSYDAGEASRFYRTIRITGVSADELAVESVVKWKGRGESDFKADIEDHFFNWRECTAN